MNLSARVLYGLGVPLNILKPMFRNFRGNWGSYRPFFQPWRESELFKRFLGRTDGARLYSDEIFWHVYQFARLCTRVEGEIWECGVYRGAASVLMSELLVAEGVTKTVRLFDTFSGLPEASELDKYRENELGDTSLESVQARLRDYEFVRFHQGLMPDTFRGLEASVIAFALIDVDQQRSTSDCIRFVYPRLARGGIIVIDDYGRPGTYGCRVAVDEYLAEIGQSIVTLNTGQGVVFKTA